MASVPSTPLALAALLEDIALLGHFLGLLLAHEPAQHISAAQGVSRQFLGDLHHLLLVQDDAVGRLQDGLQTLVLVLGIRVGDFLPTVLAVDKVVHHTRLQGTGSEQGHQGDDILESSPAAGV